MLKEKISGDLITALKAHEELRVSTLRLLTSAIRNEEIAQRKGEDVKLNDDAVLAVIRREVKQRNDAIDEYKKGGRQDLVDKETAEKTILESYLPAQLSDDELTALVAKGVATSGAIGPNDFGKAMKAVMALVQGRADGGRVSTILKVALTK
ncbi:MAG: GatB/YqeY domain-containing protein [Candidatus Yonathbacteria bacterium]|nr:GatB/YqeY domain-containing protein [Candidatus Yonathbacteria bacterium]